MTYTPTTQQVREAYEVAHESCGLPPSGNEFDIWLEIHDAEVSARALRNAAKEFEAHDAELRAQIAREIETVPDLSISHLGTRPLPALIRKDTAARIARGEKP